MFVQYAENIGNEIEDTNGIIWVIDPIDGTMNFVHMNPIVGEGRNLSNY